MDPFVNGYNLSGAISISQRWASPLAPQRSFNVIEVSDLDENSAGFFGCMIEGFVKAPPRVGPTSG
jgi:hypothetical protein